MKPSIEFVLACLVVLGWSVACYLTGYNISDARANEQRLVQFSKAETEKWSEIVKLSGAHID